MTRWEGIVRLASIFSDIYSNRSLEEGELSEAVALVAKSSETLLTESGRLPRHGDYEYLLGLSPSERCRYLIIEYVGYLRRRERSDPEKSAYHILTSEVEQLSQPHPNLYETWGPVLEEFQEEQGL